MFHHAERAEVIASIARSARRFTAARELLLKAIIEADKRTEAVRRTVQQATEQLETREGRRAAGG